MKKDRLIPFKYMPASWGLSGEAYEIAEASYYYEGIELEIKVASIKNKNDAYRRQLEINEINRRHSVIKDHEYELNKLDIERSNSKISEYDYKSRLIILNKNLDQNIVHDYELALLKRDHNVITDTEYKLEFAKLELQEGKVTELEYEKRVATINDAPWVKVLNLDTDPDNPGNGSLELDWNTKFVEELKDHGYEGATEEQIVDQWLSELCKTIAAQKFAGVGTFDEEMNIDSMNDNIMPHQFIKSKSKNNRREVK